MPYYKFERLEVWKHSLDYIDLLYTIADKLPKKENFNLKDQLVRAGTSISLNIAEGSTVTSDAEQARFLAISIRSLVETVACLRLIERRGYLIEKHLIDQAINKSHVLARQLQAMRNTLQKKPTTVQEPEPFYDVNEDALQE